MGRLIQHLHDAKKAPRGEPSSFIVNKYFFKPLGVQENHNQGNHYKGGYHLQSDEKPFLNKLPPLDGTQTLTLETVGIVLMVLAPMTAARAGTARTVVMVVVVMGAR